MNPSLETRKLSNQKVHSEKFISLFGLYMCAILVIYILPRFKVTVPYVFAAVTMLFIAVIVWLKCTELTNYICVLFFASGMVGLFGILTGVYSPSDGINEMIRQIRFFIPVLATVYALNHCTKKQCGFILVFFSVLSLYILYKTTIALEAEPWIARILAQGKSSDTTEIRAYRMQNVGGFDFSYMVGIVTVALVWLALNSKKKRTVFLSLIAAIFFFNYIIQTMYTTLLLLTSVCILLLIFMRIKDVYAKIAVILLGIISIFALPSLFEYLSHQFDGSLLSSKFSQIHKAMTGGGVDSLGSRPELMQNALQSWIRHPIFGGPSENLNAHSLIVGTLASNGIVGLGVYVILLTLSYKLILQTLSLHGVNPILFKVTFLYVVALSFFNPIGYVFEITIAAFFVVPLFLFVAADYDIE